MDDPALEHCPTRRRLAVKRDRVLLCDLDEFGIGIVDGHSAIDLAILPADEPRLGARQLHGALYETVQHVLEIESRAADGLENLGSRGLASMCLSKLLLQINVRTPTLSMRIPHC